MKEIIVILMADFIGCNINLSCSNEGVKEYSDPNQINQIFNQVLKKLSRDYVRTNY